MNRRTVALAISGLVTGMIFLHGCGSLAPLPPAIQNINASTTPTSPVSLPIEINGSSFQAAPGKVTFTQGAITKDVVPAAAAWSDTGLVVAVPAGNGTTNFTVPGSVNVTVTTSAGASNAVALSLVQTVTFSPSSMGWTTTTALPAALSGVRAAAVTGATRGTAFAVVTGGYNGTANTSTVRANTLAASGAAGGSWTTITAAALPETRAHHAMAAADPTNSLVAAGARFVYVIGGQKLSSDAPGGTSTVFVAGVDPSAGIVGAWSALSSTLPQALLGTSATVYNGYLYVVGGLTTTGAPSAAVYSAPVNADGTLGAWTTSTHALPTATAFGAMFGFGGKLYFIGGDTGNSTTPNNQANGTTNTYYTGVSHGVVGTWGTLSTPSKGHAKGIVWSAFGQVIFGEGIYNGSPGSSEFQVTAINADSTVGSWNGLTGSQAPNANVYNAAAFVSPLISGTNAPRFLLLGGQAFTGSSGAGGALSSTVYVNNAP